MIMNENEFDDFMEERSLAAEFFNNRIKKCFDAAFGEINCDLFIGYSHEYGQMDCDTHETKNGKLTIYTNRPGIVIGKAGCNIDKLKAALKDEFGFDYNINIKEIRSGIYIKKRLNKDTVVSKIV